MSYPFIPQYDLTDCGPAALAMVAAFYKKDLSAAGLREAAGTSERGTTVAGLIEAAEQVGFEVRAVRATPEALAQFPLPAIAHWQRDHRDHFIVIYHVGRTQITIADPAEGLLKIDSDEFHRHWTGIAVLLRNKLLSAAL